MLKDYSCVFCSFLFISSSIFWMGLDFFFLLMKCRILNIAGFPDSRVTSLAQCMWASLGSKSLPSACKTVTFCHWANPQSHYSGYLLPQPRLDLQIFPHILKFAFHYFSCVLKNDMWFTARVLISKLNQMISTIRSNQNKNSSCCGPGMWCRVVHELHGLDCKYHKKLKWNSFSKSTYPFLYMWSNHMKSIILKLLKILFTISVINVSNLNLLPVIELHLCTLWPQFPFPFLVAPCDALHLWKFSGSTCEMMPYFPFMID